MDRFFVVVVGRKIQNGETISGDSIGTVDQPTKYMAKRLAFKLSRGKYEETGIHECHVYTENGDGDITGHLIYKDGKQTHNQF